MLKYDWDALQALRHIRELRPVEVTEKINILLVQIVVTLQINEGFLQQLADLDYKLRWYKQKVLEE